MTEIDLLKTLVKHGATSLRNPENCQAMRNLVRQGYAEPFKTSEDILAPIHYRATDAGQEAVNA